MNAQQYLRECFEEHKRSTGETNKIIAKRLGCRPNWLSMLTLNPQHPPSLSNYKALARAIPTVDEERLLALILQDQHAPAADMISIWLKQSPFTESEAALVDSLRQELAARGFTRDWDFDAQGFKTLVREMATLILNREAAEADAAA